MITARELIDKITEIAEREGEFILDFPIKYGSHVNGPAIVVDQYEVTLKIAQPPGAGMPARRDPFGTSNVA